MEKSIEDLNRIYNELNASATDEKEKKHLIGCTLDLIHHYHELSGIEINGVIKAKIPIPEFLKLR
jgi:hypothetical protein